MARRKPLRSASASSFLKVGWAGSALVLVFVGCALALAAMWGLTALGEFLVVQDNPSGADAIVVLSGDGGARLEQGVELYRRGFAPLLIFTGAGQGDNPSAAEVMTGDARAEGVPDSKMLQVTRSTSTREDALYTRELMVSHQLRSAILVTSPYHQRRASMTFAKAFEGSGISVASYPVQDDQWQPDSWWQHSSTIQLTIRELIKLAYYKLNGYL